MWFLIFFTIFTFTLSKQMKNGISQLPYSSLFTVSFCFFPLLTTTGIGGLYIPSDFTFICVLISIASYFIAYNARSCKAGYRGYTQLYDTNSRYIFIANVIASCILLYLAPVVLEFQATHLFRQTRDEESLTEFFGSPANYTIYAYVVKTIFSVSFLVLFDDLMHGIKIKKTLLYLVMANLLGDTLLFGGRSLVVQLLMYVFFYIIFFNKEIKLTKKQKRNIFTTLLIVLVSTGYVMFLVTKMRTEDQSDSMLFDHFIMYYLGPFVLFDYHLTNSDLLDLFNGGIPYCGTCLFGPIYNFFFMAFSAVTGVDYTGSDYLISQVTETKKAQITSSGLSINAAVTAMYPFIKDFSLLGLIVGFAFFGYMTRYLKVIYLKTHSRRIRLYTIIFLFVLFKLEMRYDLSPITFIQLLLIYYFTKKSNIVYE